MQKSGMKFRMKSEKKKVQYPLLAKAARRYLAAPPTTVASEWVFSRVGMIYEPKRKRLQGKKANKLLFCNTNLPLCNFTYKY